MCQACTGGQVRARARVQVLENSGSRMVMLRFTTLSLEHCQREIATDEIQEKRNYREHSNIKSAHVSALTGSVPRKMAEAWQRISALIRNRTHIA